MRIKWLTRMGLNQGKAGEKGALLRSCCWRTSGQDGGVGRHTVPPCTTKRRTTTIKNKKQPELTENRTVWKSDNQGDKEEMFIQTGRRGGAARAERTCGKVMADGPREARLVERVVPHSPVDKLGGTTGEQDRPCNPGLQHGEIKPQTSD